MCGNAFALIQLIQGDDQSLKPLDHFQSLEQWLMHMYGVSLLAPLNGVCKYWNILISDLSSPMYGVVCVRNLSHIPGSHQSLINYVVQCFSREYKRSLNPALA
jgi:hypothetical protein